MVTINDHVEPSLHLSLNNGCPEKRQSYMERKQARTHARTHTVFSRDNRYSNDHFLWSLHVHQIVYKPWQVRRKPKVYFNEISLFPFLCIWQLAYLHWVVYILDHFHDRCGQNMHYLVWVEIKCTFVSSKRYLHLMIEDVLFSLQIYIQGIYCKQSEQCEAKKMLQFLDG